MTGTRLIALCMACTALGGAIVNTAWICVMRRVKIRITIRKEAEENAHIRADHGDHMRDPAADPRDQRVE